MGDYLFDAFTAVRRAEDRAVRRLHPRAGRRGDPLALLGHPSHGHRRRARRPATGRPALPPGRARPAGPRAVRAAAHRGARASDPRAPASSTPRSAWRYAGGARPVLGLERARDPGRLPGPPRRARPAGDRPAAAGGLRQQRPAGRHRAARSRACATSPSWPTSPAPGCTRWPGSRPSSRRWPRAGWTPASLGGAVADALAERATRSVGVQDRRRLPRRARAAPRPHPPAPTSDGPRTAGSPDCERSGRTGWTTRRWSRTPSAPACRSGLPLQVHTGYGDPDLTLHRADPSLLTPFLRALPADAGAGRAAALLPLPPAGRLPRERVPAGDGRRQPRGQPRRPARGRRARRDARARAVRVAALRLRRVRPRRAAPPRRGAVPPGARRGCSTSGWPRRAERRRREPVRPDGRGRQRPADLPARHRPEAARRHGTVRRGVVACRRVPIAEALGASPSGGHRVAPSSRETDRAAVRSESIVDCASGHSPLATTRPSAPTGPPSRSLRVAATPHSPSTASSSS